MAVTPKGIVAPDLSAPFNLVADLNTLASTADTAIGDYSNVLKGTAAQRATATSSTANGVLWQDTDGMKMIWRKDGSGWVPAVTRWTGTTTQMNAFTTAPAGFEWFNTSNNMSYVRFSGAWRPQPKILTGRINVTFPPGGGLVKVPVTFPSGFFSSAPMGFTTIQTGITEGFVFATCALETTSGMEINVNRSNGTTTNVKWQAIQV